MDLARVSAASDARPHKWPLLGAAAFVVIELVVAIGILWAATQLTQPAAQVSAGAAVTFDMPAFRRGEREALTPKFDAVRFRAEERQVLVAPMPLTFDAPAFRRDERELR